MDAVSNLYSKLSAGGYVIIDDDYSLLPRCKQGADDFSSVVKRCRPEPRHEIPKKANRDVRAEDKKWLVREM